ncbi:unnamed protein product [Didymodactylos carnosus]|nr:unnamed protein product [Didymodactylos carnosus]CAF4423370.1 unnamed protein product [Didymodactylos carnosus]
MNLSTIGTPIFRVVDAIPGCCDNYTNGNYCIPEQFKKYNYSEGRCEFQDFGFDENYFEYQYNSFIYKLMVFTLFKYQKYLQWFNIFAYFWIGAFLYAFEEIVLAGVFSDYYWSNDKTRKMSPLPLLNSIFIVIRYHIGSIAFGSLLIASLRFIRLLLNYLNEKLSKVDDNIIFRFIFKCLSCIFWCFEKFIKFLNKNAYVLIAARGYGFCKATRKVFGYMLSNCLRFFVITQLTELILICGTITICSLNAFLFYRYLIYTNQLNQLIIPWAPMVVLIALNYLIISICFSTFDMAVKTIFICFLEDLDINDGTVERPYVMNNDLLNLIGKANALNNKNIKQKKVKLQKHDISKK